MEQAVYSIRMRASLDAAHEDGGKHITGAERLVCEEQIDDVVLSLIKRAYKRGVSIAHTHITIDRIETLEIKTTPCLDLKLSDIPDAQMAHMVASNLLIETGISEAAIAQAFSGLFYGFYNSQAIRGAALLDSITGHRVDKPIDRGVRASRFDWAPGDDHTIRTTLAQHGLTHFRTQEALALATKVIHSGVLAEICWSDENDYTAGYISVPSLGYIRFPHFKPPDAVGGRAFFINTSQYQEIVDRLQKLPLWITPPLNIESISTKI